jgi:uncharacterized coiled-coil protein SlyX
MRRALSWSTLLLGTSMLTAVGGGRALADDTEARIDALARQIHAQQIELQRLKHDLAERTEQMHAMQARMGETPAARVPPVPVMPVIPQGYALVPAAPGAAPGSVVLARAEPPAEKPLPKGSFQVGAVNVQLGGFFEAAGFYRSRNEQTDLASSFTSGIPERNSPLYHEPESGFSARQTRVSATMTASPDEVTKLTGSLIIDFLGTGPTSNYNESNSWNPRIREAWIDYARSDYGFYVLGGQTWTLATMNSKGVDPTAIDLPLQIDPQYVVGLNWARQAQFRVAKNLGSDQFWAALSIENPATIVSGTAPTIAGTTINQSNAGIGVDATGGTFTNNFAPDVILKTTADFPIAHLEAYGLGRAFNDRVSTLGTGRNDVVLGGGFGGGAMVHIIPKMLDLHLSGLVGDGVGRYGTSQLPDATYNAAGKPVALPGYSGYVGLIAHPDADNDAYAYFGVEHVSARYDLGLAKGKETTLAGYGSPLINNISCGTEDATEPAACSPATSGDAEITVGDWYKFIQGKYGKMQIGAQYSYVRRYVFQGIGPTPKTDENMLFISFRWYPFT